MKKKTIRQTVSFKATPHEVYETLMDSRKHARFTEAGARISRKVGGKISAYDGYVDGLNLYRPISQGWKEHYWEKMKAMLEA